LKKIRLFYNDVSGDSGVEYGLLLVCVALAIIFAGGFLGSALNNLFSTIAAELPFYQPG
jgi:Flp pilus assembly pilin Flp